MVFYFNLSYLIVLGFIHFVAPYQLFLGECPIYVDEPCQLNAIQFILSTKSGNETILDPFNPVLPKNFNIFAPTKILIHGYGGLSIDIGIKNISSAYQQIGYNVIIVNWEILSSLPCYVTAYINTWHVGQCVAILAVSLMPLGINPKFLHLIGFSLGAHIAGFAGAHLRRNLGISLQRITGLDPALPFFATLKNDWKLNQNNADFVDIIHTSAGSFGKIEANGHVDFYVNGGLLQAACYNAPNPPLCSHIMSGIYFAESILNSNRSFIGRECESIANYIFNLCFSRNKAIMGEFISTKTRGTYFVETASQAPFALD